MTAGRLEATAAGWAGASLLMDLVPCLELGAATDRMLAKRSRKVPPHGRQGVPNGPTAISTTLQEG